MSRSLSHDDLSQRTARAVDLATQYFAYIAGVSVAVAIATVTLVYSAQTALTWVDVMAFPERHPIHSGPSAKSPLPAQPDKLDPVSNTFAMLPSAMPLNLKNDVLSSNF